MNYSEMTEEQIAKRREYRRKYKAEHREKYRERARRKYRSEEHREKRREHKRKWSAVHKEYRRKWQAEHREEHNERQRNDLNKYGKTKNSIRCLSNKYLLSMHSKLEGYEIHHAFGYDDYRRFIYIPKTLHLDIHQLLRDNNIPADSDHWMTIRDMVNSCEQYTYISV